MIFEYAALTDVGRLRANNGDAVLVSAEYGVAILADGMGGYNAGKWPVPWQWEHISSELIRWLARQRLKPACGMFGVRWRFASIMSIAPF